MIFKKIRTKKLILQDNEIKKCKFCGKKIEDFRKIIYETCLNCQLKKENKK